MSKQPHILLVEDEASLADTLALNLKLSNYRVILARTGKEALQLFYDYGTSIDLAILDIMLPDINGKELCSKFKAEVPELPVIFLTARGELGDRIEGLKLGAEDYITKPFDLEELLLRIANLLKRSAKREFAVFKFPGGEINFSTFEIRDQKGILHTLSKREIKLLELLSANVNRVISRDEIIEKLWNDDENASSRTIDNYILGFRKLFEANPKEPQHFHSVRGVGYKFTL